MKTTYGNPDDYNDWDNYKNRNPYTNVPKPWIPNPHEPWEGTKTKGAAIPKAPTINDLFPSLDRWAIGWSPILETLKQMSVAKPSYPPYDIIDQKNDTTLINVAVAGFSKKEITVTVEEQVLKIEGKKEGKEAEGIVVHNGIAGRNFTLTFALAEYYEIDSAKLSEGILAVKLVKNVPDEKKPKVIEIR